LCLNFGIREAMREGLVAMGVDLADVTQPDDANAQRGSSQLDLTFT
jgi:hypothetical protein